MKRTRPDAITPTVTIDPYDPHPWEMSDEERSGLLAWFMELDFSEPDNLKVLVALNRASRGPRSQESVLRKQSMEALAAGIPTFVAFYTEIRRLLRNAREFWQRATNEHNAEQKELLATLALRAFKDLREEVTSLEVERHRGSDAVVWPPRGYPAPQRRAWSLPGELAIAMYDEMLGARTAGLCDVCHEPWLSRRAKPRGRARKRRLCGRAECWATWRNTHRKPEDPKKVTARVTRWRAAERLRLAKKARGNK